jgi:2-methylcitrate dehydratase PrpD
MIKNNYGYLAEVEVMSALMARKGFTGPRDIFEGDDGFWRMYGSDRCDLGKITEGLGQDYLIMQSRLKPYPARRGIHTVIACAENIRQNHKIDADKIDTVVVTTQAQSPGAPYDNAKPRSIAEAVVSIPYLTALALTGVEPGTDWYTESRLKNKALLSLARKVRVVTKPEFDDFPRGGMGAKMQVTVKGTTYEAKVREPKGTPNNPMTCQEVEQKFGSFATNVIRQVKAEEAIRLLRQLENLPDVNVLTELFRGMSKA